MQRLILTAFACVTVAATSLLATPMLVAACAGLIGSNGAVNLGRTTTLAAYHAAGGDAIFSSNRFEHRFRDMHTLTQQVQARPDQYEAVGQYLLGLEPNTRWL